MAVAYGKPQSVYDKLSEVSYFCVSPELLFLGLTQTLRTLGVLLYETLRVGVGVGVGVGEASRREASRREASRREASRREASRREGVFSTRREARRR
nr:hypothetical protein [Nostoc sp. CreGUA01]